MDIQASRRWYTFAYGTLFTLLTACGGGGTSGCGASCGLGPIQNGFPAADRLSNAAQIRLTSHGLDFLETNVDDVVATFLPDGLDFDIPRTSGSLGPADYELCPGRNCGVHIEVQSMSLTPRGSHTLRVLMTATLDSRNSRGARAAIPLNLDAGFLGSTSCGVDVNTTRGARRTIGIQVDINLIGETTSGRLRYGLTKIKVDESTAGFASGQGIETDDVDVSDCSGFLGTVVELIVPLVKGTLVTTVEEQVPAILQSAVNGALCQTRGTAGCPSGTSAVPNENPASICRYGSREADECLPILLGFEGQGDLGAALLGSFSPGTKGPVQLMLGSGGNAESVSEGMSLFFEGGLRSSDITGDARNSYHSACVPRITPPAKPTVARVESFRGNTIPGTATPIDVGIGLSEDYLNWAGYGMFDSGMLCLAAGTSLSQQLSTGLLSVLSGNLPRITYPIGSAPVSINLRPQKPPIFEVGAGTPTDPMLTVTLPELDMDFYTWVSERYARFMTYRTDLKLALNLSVEGGEIVPSIVSIESTNASVSNTELLGGNTAGIPAAMQSILGLLTGMLTSAIPGFAIPEVMGFELEIPANGVKGIADGGEEFIGIFANLAIATTPILAPPVDTAARVDLVSIDPISLELATFRQGRKPVVRVTASTPDAHSSRHALEYSYRVDNTNWSAWTTNPVLNVESEAFYFQARHEIEVRSRIVGSPKSVDPTPARVEVLIDTKSPDVLLDRSGDKVTVEAGDLVTPASKLMLRYKSGSKNGPQIWSTWAPFTRLLPKNAFAVEVKDEVGNVGSARVALIRGVANPNAPASGCGCRVDNQSKLPPLGWIGLLGLLGVIVARHRNRLPSAALVVAAAMAATGAPAMSGCGASSNPRQADGGGVVGDTGPRETSCEASCGSDEVCCMAESMCVAYDADELCEPGTECEDGAVTTDDSCAPTCSNCVPKRALEPGSLGTYLDAVWVDDSKLVLTGYSAGIPGGRKYGDLVIGEWSEGATDIEWNIVDGVPAEDATNDPRGWRGGISANGDDVGRWSSVAAAADGKIYIAYYDATNKALKVATPNEVGYQIFTVDDTGITAGQYASIAINSDGIPVVAYMRIVNSPSDQDKFKGQVVVATASNAAPTAGDDFTSEVVDTTNVACRAEWCDAGEVCLGTGECAVPGSGCSTCAAGTACVDRACQEVLPAEYIEDMPVSTGLFCQLEPAPTGMALVYYDRTKGSLFGAKFQSGEWRSPVALDGYSRMGGGDYDAGIGASLFVDSTGLWHVAYVDGTNEALRYLTYNGTSIVRAVVDDGTTDGEDAFTDGKHVIGDDSSVAVLSNGQVRIVYQDATNQTQRFASKSGSRWDRSVIAGDATVRAGFFNKQIPVGTVSYIANWWLAPGNSDNGVLVQSR